MILKVVRENILRQAHQNFTYLAEILKSEGMKEWTWKSIIVKVDCYTQQNYILKLKEKYKLTMIQTIKKQDQKSTKQTKAGQW